MRIVVALHPECSVEWQGVSRVGRRTTLSDAALLMTLKRGVELTEIDKLTTTVAGHTARSVLDVLQQRRLLQWRLLDADGAVVAAAAPLVAGEEWPDFTTHHEGSLSRFASVHKRSGEWRLESGASTWEVDLQPAALTLLAINDPEFVDFLAPLGMLNDHDESPSLVLWEPADLAVAGGLSLDRDPEHVGGSFRFRERLEPTPFDQTADFSGETVVLPVAPALPTVALSDLIDQRRSVRDFSDEPLPLLTLSRVLWNTLRVTRLVPRNPDDSESYDWVMKPVPTSGAVAAIDVWVMARNVADLAAGTWWYNPMSHQLHRTSDQWSEQGLATDPQVTLVLATRHERLAWKYERLAYALALRDTGVVMHALQLTATALGLGACPQGGAAHAALATLMGAPQLQYMPTGVMWLGIPADGPSV